MSLRRIDIVRAARAWIGTPYAHQCSTLGAGCDCLGLVRGVWRACVGPEREATGPYTPDWAEASGEERLAEAALRHLRPLPVDAFGSGDVILFRWRDGAPAKHCAVATSASSMIHAHDGACVCETPISPFWRRRIAFAFGFPGVID